MSENEKKNNPKKSSGKSDFEDFEEAFFTEGEFQVQEAKTGNYMAEDFGTELWEDFDLPLDAPKALSEDEDIGIPKVAQQPAVVEVIEEESEEADAFSLDGFELEDEPIPDLQPEAMVTVEIDDFSLDDLEDFDVETGDLFPAVEEQVEPEEEVEPEGKDDSEDKTVPIKIQIEQFEPPEESFVLEDFGVATLEEQDDFLEFGDSIDDVFESVIEPLEEQGNVQTVTTEVGIVVLQEGDDDFSLEDDLSLEDEIEFDDIVDAPLGVSISLDKPVATPIQEVVEEPPPPQPLVQRKRVSIEGAIDILLEEAGQTKRQDLYCEAARRVYVQGKTEEALDILMRVEDVEKSKDYLHLLLQASYDCSDVRVFQKALHELLPLVSPQERGVLWTMGAKIDLLSAQDASAQEKLQHAIQEDSNNSYAQLLLWQNSKRLGLWGEYIQATKELARMSPQNISSILLQMAAEVALERCGDREDALELMKKSSSHQGRIYKKMMTRLGWGHHEAEEKPSTLLDLYGALVNLAQSKQNLQHDMLRWVQILAANEQSALQEQQVFAEGSEKQIIEFLLARDSVDNLQGNLLQSDPSILFGLRGDISTVGEAQQILIHCEPEKHGSATRFAIVQDLYRTKGVSSGPAKPKLGRAWLGVRRGRMALNPTEMTDIFDFPGAGVIQELWYIHLSMREELEALYIKRAKSSSEPQWKAHWLYQAGLVQNNRALFAQARAISEHIPVGYTREYISAWKDWQFGEGEFLDCIELLEKQAQVCDTLDFKVAVSLLKGEQSEMFHTLRILSDEPVNSDHVSQAMNDLTEHEKGWLSLTILFSKPGKEVFKFAFSHAPPLPTDLLLALALTTFELDDPELYALLDAQLGTSKEDQELRLALLFVSNNEAKVTKGLQGMSIDTLREDCSILAEICGMWNIAQEYAAHTEEVFGGMHPAETRRVLEERLVKQPSLDVALHLANMCTDSLSSYQYLTEASRGTAVQYGFQAAYVDNQNDAAVDFKEIFEGKPIWGSHTQQLVQSLSEQKETQELLHIAQRCPEFVDEIIIRLLSLSSWEGAKTLLSQTVPGLVYDLRMESIANGSESWEEYYHLLQKRMADTQSQAVREQAESKCAHVMLEHLADRDFTLTYYQAKADANPGNNDHLEALSRIAIAQGNIQKGIQALETLYEQATSSEQAAQYLFRIGEALESDGRTLPAIEKLKLALDLYPPAQEIRTSLKSLLYKNQYTDNLITVLQQEIEITQGDKQREVMKELALLHEEKLQEYEKSINIWAKIWHKNELDQEALNKLIDLSNTMKDDKQAVEYMQALFSIQPSAELIMDIAHRVQSFEDKSLFEKALLKATDFESVRMTALQKLSEYYRLHQESEKYSQAMLSIVEETDSDVDKVRILEQILVENEQSIRSQETLFQICSMIEQLEPNHTQSIRFIAEYHYQAQNYDLSIPFFERVLHTYKEEEIEEFEGRMRYSDLLFRFANALRLENRKNDSIRRLRELLKLIPYHMQALRLIGPMLIEEGALDEASQTYKSLLMNVGSESPEAFPLYLELGDIEVARGDNDQAIQFFVRAFRMEPENIRVIHSLAQLCVKQKRWNKALQLYQKLLSTRKITKAVTMEGMLVKAWILNKNLNLHDKAYKHLEQSLQYEANQPIVLLCMAEMRYQKGEYASAIQLLERMMTLEEGPYNNLALMLKSACLQKEGRDAEGLAIQELLKITSEELDSRLKEGFSQPLY